MQTARNAIQTLVLLALILLAGTLGYHFLEGWSLLDAVYMTVITLATVGYGETHPLSVSGRIFTMFLILGGMGIILYGVSELTAFVVEGGMTGLLRRNKMTKLIKKLSHHYIVCGTGNNGHYVIEELVRTKRTVVVVEKDRHKVNELLDRGIPAIEGDASNDAVLEAAGIHRAAGLVTTLPEDKDNLFVVITARGLNDKIRIIAKIDDVGARDKFLRSGADSAVSASSIGGLRMASEMIRPDTVTFLDAMLRDNSTLRVEDIHVGASSSFVGKTINECDVLHSHKTLVVAKKHGTEFEFNPEGTHRLAAGDTFVVIATPQNLEQVRKKLS
jgi:voltage-gated potassium channel